MKRLLGLFFATITFFGVAGSLHAAEAAAGSSEATGESPPAGISAKGKPSEPDKTEPRRTRISIAKTRWWINGAPAHLGSPAAGLLLNVRMVNATFEDGGRERFDADANTDRLIARLPEYAAAGVNAITLNLQGGAPGYEGAINSAFDADGSLRPESMRRVGRVIAACDRLGIAVILGCFYQRQDQILKDQAAVRAAVRNVARWLRTVHYENVLLEIANEFGHHGFDHALLKESAGLIELARLAKREAPGILVSTSFTGDRGPSAEEARELDFILVHFNSTSLDKVPARLEELTAFGKPVVCNEDEKLGAAGVEMVRLCAGRQVSWGIMNEAVNQRFPFEYRGMKDDPLVFAEFQRLSTAIFPPPESQGGWAAVDRARLREEAGMDPEKLDALKAWLLASDQRPFAAVVIRHGRIVLEVERDKNSRTDTGNIKSCAKAICATVLAIASEASQHGGAKRMTFDDPAFDFIPWAQPLSDPRKAKITVKQLLNHTSGITPESTGESNQGPWQHILGHDGDPATARLAFDPGTDLDYSSHAFYHAALVCENVTGKPYDQFAIESLLKPIGVETWRFESFDGDAKHGRHASHVLGLPAREMARIAMCMLHDGKWGQRQVIPQWFVAQTGAPTHSLSGKREPTARDATPRDKESFSSGWELPGRLSGERGRDIPRDARFKPGSGGQLIAFVPSLDLVVVRQTGGSGAWKYEEYLRRACEAAVDGESK